MSRNEIERLIEAGAIVAPGADGDTVDVITARRYRHPALGEQAVVTLVPGTLGPAEDLAMEFLGFEAGAEPVVVGSGRRQALGFPAWAVINDPVNGHHALALVKDIERLARQARSKPGQAREGFEALGERLSRAVPHFLPTFYEQVGRAFLAADNRQIAATMFGRAREAERVHALPIDENRQRDVFLEFAFSGALTAKSLTQHAKDLSLRAEPVAAYELFLRICVERVAGGLPPYSGMADDLRRLAKAAGLATAEQDERVVAGLLDSPALPHAPLAFWKAYTPALTRLAQADVAVRARLLDLLPASEQPGTEDLWFDLLASTGALRGLIEVDDDPAVGRPRDGAAGWLARVVRWQGRGWGNATGSKRVLDLVGEMAPRLRAEGTALKVLESSYWRADVDLVDLCLDLGLEIVVPADLHLLSLSGWLDKDASGRRDLATLAATDWAREALVKGLEDVLTRMVGTSWHHDRRPTVISPAAVQPLLDNAGTRQIVRLWLERLADSAGRAALPELEETFSRLVPAALDVVLGVAPQAAARLSGVDISRALARTLRIGLFDELTWPALEQAVAEYPPPVVPTAPYWNMSPQVQFQVCDSWPMLILTSPARVTVVGPDGVLMRHDPRFPASRPIGGGTVTADYVDGKLLVAWSAAAGSTGYWDAHPDALFDVKDDWLQHYRRPGAGGQPLPGGGRTGGGRPLLPGDTTVTAIKPVAGDGEHWWRWSDSGWREYDPQTGDAGRQSRPAFFEAALARGDDAELLEASCRLAPIQPGLENTPLGTADGLLGWRVVRLPDGGRLGESITGAVLRLSPEYVTRHSGFEPAGLLQLPASTGPLGVLVDHWWACLTSDDVVGSRIQPGGVHQPYARGTALVPPISHWHALRPRDEPGSAALRAFTDAQAHELLQAAQKVAENQPLDATIRRSLPGITDPQLVAGVAGVLEIAVGLARQVQSLPAPASGSSALVPGSEQAPTLPDDQLGTALAGLTGGRGSWYGYHSRDQSSGAFDNLRAVVALLANPPKKKLLERIGLTQDGTEPAALPGSRVEWTAVIGGLGALALRAASAATPEKDRAALVALLGEVQGTPLAEPNGWWREAVLSGTWNASLGAGSSLPTSTGTAVVVGEPAWDFDEKQRVRVVEHSPSGRFGKVPGYAVTSSRVAAGWGGAARIGEFLELLSTRGPAPWRPEAVDALVAATGMSRAEAALLLAGLPGGHAQEHNFLDKQTRETLGLKVAEAAAAQPTFKRIEQDDRLLLLGLAMPDRPADYWEHGPDVEALAAGWIRKFGRRTAIPGQLLTELTAVMSNVSTQPASAVLQGIADPDDCGWLSRDRKWQIKDQHLHATGDDSGFDGYRLAAIVAALVWLAYRLPLDDPFRARLAPALAALRQRLANPSLLISVLDGNEIPGLRQLFGHAAAPRTPVGGRRTAVTLDLGPAGILVAGDWSDSVYVRPALLEGPGDPLLKLSDGLYDPTSAALRILADPAFDRLFGTGAGPGSDTETGIQSASDAGGTGPLGAGPFWAQDPLVSAPELVPLVAAELGVDTDAARLYLQLLALPDPSDKNVLRWNGWTAKDLKPATAALRAVGAVVDGKRSRTGRTAFLPCGWLDLSTPYPPIEVWKVSLLGLLPDGRGPLALTVPTVPIGELFQQAWERVVAGDGPRLEQFESGRRR